jgi:hypothetical protein
MTEHVEVQKHKIFAIIDESAHKKVSARSGWRITFLRFPFVGSRKELFLSYSAQSIARQRQIPNKNSAETHEMDSPG